MNLKQLWDGASIQCFRLDDDIFEIQLNAKEESINKFNTATLNELSQVVQALKKRSLESNDLSWVRGVLLSSAKECFVVGADVTEFLAGFEKPEAELKEWLKSTQRLFSELEDLPYPTLAAINGVALGGGFEVTLALDYRVMSVAAQVGLPEIKLGIFPGWGGTVRLPRLVGVDTALEWILSGESWNAEHALKVGVVDAVLSARSIRIGSVEILKRAISGQLDWQSRKTNKKAILKLTDIEMKMIFESAKAFVMGQAHYPAPLTVVRCMQKSVSLEREAALEVELTGFMQVAKTPVATSLVGLFLGDQWLKKKNKKQGQGVPAVDRAAVLGAGIMGGGIAYQAAYTGSAVWMKDVQWKSIELGLSEARKLLGKQVARKKMTLDQMSEVLAKIHPALSYGDFSSGEIQFIVEAVTENESVKKSVLLEVEKQIHASAVLASNTSTISISRLAEGLQRPENFCGMHFFNPVHRMPLVEVIRGKRSSPATIAKAVAYALQMKKIPIVVNDCPGFLVNRVLFPYFQAFMELLADGISFHRIDEVMEKWGWPMGPAYLLDVVGIDTAHHAQSVMAQAFPERMKLQFKSALDVLYEKKRFGQKTTSGFYRYSLDAKGVLKKQTDPEMEDVEKIFHCRAVCQVSDQDIVERMLLPMGIEASRCLEEAIVSSPVEVDLGVIYGLGFPPFRGGILKFFDSVGLSAWVELAQRYHHLGGAYQVTEQMKTFAQQGLSFYHQRGGA